MSFFWGAVGLEFGAPQKKIPEKTTVEVSCLLSFIRFVRLFCWDSENLKNNMDVKTEVDEIVIVCCYIKCDRPTCRTMNHGGCWLALTVFLCWALFDQHEWHDNDTIIIAWSTILPCNLSYWQSLQQSWTMIIQWQEIKGHRRAFTLPSQPHLQDLCWALHSDCQGTMVDHILEASGWDRCLVH